MHRLEAGKVVLAAELATVTRMSERTMLDFADIAWLDR